MWGPSKLSGQATDDEVRETQHRLGQAVQEALLVVGEVVQNEARDEPQEVEHVLGEELDGLVRPTESPKKLSTLKQTSEKRMSMRNMPMKRVTSLRLLPTNSSCWAKGSPTMAL